MNDHDPPRSDLFLFPDESGSVTQEPSPNYPMLHSPLISPPVSSMHHESDDFCILDTPGLTAVVSDLITSVMLSVTFGKCYKVLVQDW